MIAGLAAAVLVAASPASAGVLYDQTTGPSSGSITSSDFGVANKVSQGADDFTVPAGANWQIASVTVNGSGSLTGSPTAAVFLYANAGSLPGTQLFSQSGIPISGVNNFTFPVAGSPLLSPGTYWISVQITDPVQWSWSGSAAQFGAVAAWRNPGNGYSTGCIAYTAVTSCLGTTSKSFMFALNSPDPAPPAPPANTSVPPSVKKKCKNKKYRKHHPKKCKKRKRL